MEVLQQVEAIMGPAGLDNADAAAPRDLLTAAVQHLRTGAPLALVRVHSASPCHCDQAPLQAPRFAACNLWVPQLLLAGTGSEEVWRPVMFSPPNKSSLACLQS